MRIAKLQLPKKRIVAQKRRVLDGPTSLGVPEFEAMKGNCRNISHIAAANEVAYLSNQYRRMWQRGSPVVELDEILKTLQAKKIPFVLTGMHGMSGWTGRPRATHDVDLLVKGGRNFSRVVNAMKSLYPNLEMRPFVGVTGFFAPDEKESLIDVTYPHRLDIQATLETAIWVKERGLRYRIPTLEAALVDKYGAMICLTRDPGKRATDAVDFYYMVKHSMDPGQIPIDLEQVATLADLVSSLTGRSEILRMIAEAKLGKVPNPHS